MCLHLLRSGHQELMYGLGISGGKKGKSKMKKISDYETRIAELLEQDNAHQKLNGKMQLRITELEQEVLETQADNKKQANQINDYIDKIHKMNNKVEQLRKDGIL